MECTQRLECLTQELYESRQERTSSEQIGFLGICGTKHPVVRGPNKIGRDPQTCNIVLDLNSVSRQHAVINVLNSKEYMIMDLDSANKTKLLNKSLQPYIPHPLRNGDTVQFGQVFGIFRLLEDDDDLPMTQALDIPDTPVMNRHVTKLNILPSTTIPESPDCSDKDESFIVSSQTKNQDVFKSPSSHYTKKIGKTITIQPVGVNKIDNAYWKSTKKSVSIDMSMDDSNENIGTVKSLTTTGKDINEDIYEMDTQVPYTTDKFEAPDAIHTADTQLSTDGPSISSLDTHLTKMNNLPDIQKTHKQQEMKLDLFTENKENNNSIFNAETQQFDSEVKKLSINENVKKSNDEISAPNLNISDEEIIFDEVDSQPLLEDFESQPLLPPENFSFDEDMVKTKNEKNAKSENNLNEEKVSRTRLNSDSSTDCDDFEFLPTQKIPENLEFSNEATKSANESSKTDNKLANANDDSTDCEDNLLETDIKAGPIKGTHAIGDDDDSTDCEDDIIPCNSDALIKKDTKYANFEDLATQVIAKDTCNEIENLIDKSDLDVDFEDMPTQVIEAVDIENTSKISDDFLFEDLPTQVLPLETPKDVIKQNKILADNLSFKVPLPSVKKNKKKEIINPDVANCINFESEDENFYNATQEIFNDLCTQNESNTERKLSLSNADLESKNKEAIPKNELVLKKIGLVGDKSSESSDGDEKVIKFVKSLSHNQIEEIIGVDKQLIRTPSDSPDVVHTPQKPFRLMETDLPNSQEIKKSVTLKTAKTFVVSSSDSESEEVEECTSIVSRKSKSHKNAKIDLTKKFETESLPTRLLTRVRKPTEKAQNSNINMDKMMRSRLLTGSEENIDTEIIMENMLRLKTKANKHKTDEEVRKSGEAKTEDKQSHVVEIPKPESIQLPGPNNRKENNKKVNAKRKSDESGKNTDKKSKDHNDKKRKKSDNSRTSETRKRSEKMSIDSSKDDKAHKKKEDTTKSNNKKEDFSKALKSEITSRHSPRKKGSAHGDNKEEKKDQTSENKSTSKHVRNQMEETKQTSKDDKDSKIKTSRSTRSKQKEANEKVESKSSAKDKIELNKGDKRKHDTEGSINETSEKEIRRSKRQKTIKSYLDPSPAQNPKPNTSRSSKHEQSTVYNISAESNEKPPQEKSVKSLAKGDEISTVRTRSVSNLSNSTSSRATPRNIKTHKVLFTAFPCEEVKEKLMQLGANVVNEVAECTVLLTLQIKRTFKLLCAIGLGRPIVGPSWVQACVDTNMVVDPWLYIIKDEASEKRFQFNLERTLTGRRNFLQGYNVSSTPSIVPKPAEMKLIVQCSGGTWKEGGAKWVCITCSSDKTLWLSLKRRGAILVSTEFILEGVLQQKLNIDKHRLS